VENRAVGFGLDGQRVWWLGERATGALGLEWVARRAVTSHERELDQRSGDETRARALAGAEQAELAAFARCGHFALGLSWSR
jgi:hypothetical protein